MSQTMMGIKEVAESLHVSTREVVRMAEKRILPSQKVGGEWRFRSSAIWNWIEDNLHSLPERRRKDRHPEATGDLLISPNLKDRAVVVDLAAKTRSSVLRELARLAESLDPFVDGKSLAEDLIDRERQGSTALQDGVAIPHPARPVYSEGPVLAVARTQQGIVFGERGGGLTDLFFLVCCPGHADHLLYLGRLCRLLIDPRLQEALRGSDSAVEFTRVLRESERVLCRG
ncbi:MAG: PTS sugar transporter subunit IIA [Phycisphaerae bacterium]